MTLEHLKRLELLKTLIALEEKELLLSQVDKLEDEVPEKSEMATTETDDKKDEKKRSGEYELPPPPKI